MKIFSSIRKRLAKSRSYTASSILFLLLCSIALFFMLEVFNNNFDTISIGYYFSEQIRPLVANVLIIFFALIIVWAITNRPVVTVAVAWVFVLILGYVNTQKITSRNTPFLPEDLAFANQIGTVTDFVTLGSITKLAIAIAIPIVICVALSRGSFLERHNLRSAKKHIPQRIISFILAGASLTGVVGLICWYAKNDIATPAILKTEFTIWNQQHNFRRNGYLVGFIYNICAYETPTPSDYDEELIVSLREKYEEIAERKNAKRKTPDDINVIIILNETFIDPNHEVDGAVYRDYYDFGDEDITPNLHEIQKKYPSGYMYSPVFGGGTANIEFEVLTGLSNNWLQTTPYTTVIPKLSYVPSITHVVKNDGKHGATAIHPYSGGMYKRNFALQKEGFDKFITEKDISFSDTEPGSDYINDSSAYRETMKVLKESDSPQVIGLITMQNHTPYHDLDYGSDKYATTKLDGGFKGYDEDQLVETQKYFQTLHTSDKYLGDFIRELDELDEKTVVLFFGDHHPGVSGGVENHTLIHSTPYFVYANYGNIQAKELPTTTPNCLVNTMLNEMGWQKTGLYYLLDDVCSESPILDAEYSKLHQDSTLSESELLNEYRLIIYDILLGKHYWNKK